MHSKINQYKSLYSKIYVSYKQLWYCKHLQTCLPAEMTWGKNDYNLGEDFEM